MTVAPALVPGALGPQRLAEAHDPRAREATMAAARQFEAILTRQILRTMRNTIDVVRGERGATGASTYVEMMDDAIADGMARSGGLGLAPTIAHAIDPRISADSATAAQEQGPVGLLGPAPEARERTPQASVPLPPIAGGRGLGARVRAVAGAMLADRPDAWGQAGTLDHTHLQSGGIAVPVADGAARFSVSDAAGYRGSYKCNLFALELLRRAGAAVPVVPRGRGVGFPSASGLADRARAGRLPSEWGRVVSSSSAGDLDAHLQGGGTILIAGAAADAERHGHVAVADRIHRVEHDADGRLTLIEYSGWEARPDRARYGRRTWRTVDGPRARGDVRGGLSHIQLVSPRAAHAGEEGGILVGRARRASSRDAVRHDVSAIGSASPQLSPRPADVPYRTGHRLVERAAPEEQRP
jgi:flagellar protein FlgJ